MRLLHHGECYVRRRAVHGRVTTAARSSSEWRETTAQEPTDGRQDYTGYADGAYAAHAANPSARMQ